MAKYRIQSKLFAGVFDPGTYNSMVNAAANNATPDAQRMLDGYSKKYAEDIAKYKNSTALTTIKPNTNIPTGTNPPNKVGVWQGLKNTYRNAGTMGKAGMIGAGILGTGLMVKGAMNMMGSSSKKEKEAAFSEDTGAALQEAAIYGTIGAGTLGAIALAKRGKLGFTKAQRANNKEAYQKVVRKVKSVWAEQGNKAKEVTQETRTVKNPGKPAETTTKTTINKVTINKSDWPKVRAYMEANGMDLRDPSAKLKAAKAVGVTPSVK